MMIKVLTYATFCNIMNMEVVVLKRKIMNELIKWKVSDSRKPLILKGARQVGKTYIALMFGKEQFKNTVYFNFDNDEILQRVFERDFDTQRIIRELSELSGKTITRDDTLVVFDEIQSCEAALNSLKYFNENDNDYYIVAAGSLLGVAINRTKFSFPVGKVDSMTLYPMDFEEFLTALEKEDLISMVRENFHANTEFSLHEIAMDYYRKYLVVGGMPAAVLDYLEKDDFNFVLATQKSIHDNYIADMAKYSSTHEAVRTMAAYQSLPAQLAKDNKKFQYKMIRTGAKAYDYEVPIAWLEASGIINKVNKVSEGKLPLAAFADNNYFKIYMTDTGLLCAKFGIPANKILIKNDEINSFKGALAENYVAAALITQGFTPFYWESNGQAEVDFVVQTSSGEIIPIEVKAAENVRSRSLGVFVKKYKPSYSIRVSGKNFGFENGIKSVPFYALFCIEN